MTIEWYLTHEITVDTVGDQNRRGFKRPYFVKIDGELLLDKSKHHARRFASYESALEAARVEVRRSSMSFFFPARSQ